MEEAGSEKSFSQHRLLLFYFFVLNWTYLVLGWHRGEEANRGGAVVKKMFHHLYSRNTADTTQRAVTRIRDTGHMAGSIRTCCVFPVSWKLAFSVEF